MATDDPRLNRLIKEGSDGDIVIVGCPYDFLRKRSSGKGGEDNGPCCLRRFYPKVGTLINPQYSIDISSLNVTDMDHQIRVGTAIQECFQQKIQRESPEKIIDHISFTLETLIKNNKIPFVFGGSKEGLLGCVQAFQNSEQASSEKTVYILSGRPFLQRPYDGDKATSDNVCSILNLRYPKSKFKVFGCQLKYCPSQFIKEGSSSQSQVNKQIFPNFEFITYQQIRKKKVEKQKKKLGMRTQALHKFIEIFNQNELSQVNISLQVLELFNGCRDLSVQGLQYDQLTQIMLYLGRQENLKAISICQFNPSCEDYQSSLIILNAFYFYLLGKQQSKMKENQQ